MKTTLLWILIAPSVVWGWTATIFFIVDYIKSRKN